MNKYLLLFVSLTLLGLPSCKRQQMARTANARSLGMVDPTARPYSSLPPGVPMPGADATASAEQGSMTVSETEPTAPTYRYLVSFFSEASGIDNEGFTAFEKWVAEYGKNLGQEITYDRILWGREGETDLCFPLKTLDESQQKAFVDAANLQLKNVKRVNISENEACRHHARP